MASSVVALIKLKDALNEYVSQSKIDLAQCNQKIYQHLYDYYLACEEGIDPILFKEDSLSFFEELILGKRFNVLRSHQKMLRLVYLSYVIRSPGYVTRNIFNSMIVLCNNKLASNIARELALHVISDILEKRLNDTASLAGDALQLVQKTLRLTDTPTRIASMQILYTLVTSDTRDMQDTFGEVFKIVSRLITDKTSYIREQTANIICGMSRRLSSFTTLTIDMLVNSISKGLEDDVASVQDACAKAIASLYECQVRMYLDKQEQSKIGAARGSDDPQQPKQQAVSRLSLPKFTSTRKVVVEEVLDFKTILDSIGKLVAKTTGASKVGYIFVLGYFVEGLLDKVTVDELELVVPAVVAVVQENSNQTLNFEDQTLLKARLSFVFRKCFLAHMTEAQLITVASQLCKLCNADGGNGGAAGGAAISVTRGELEVQFALSELNHILSVLSSAAVSLQDEVITTASLHLRNASFAIRTISANVLLVMALIVPGVGTDLLRTCFVNTNVQAQQLLQFDGSSMGALSSEPSDFLDDSNHNGGSGNNSTPPPPPAATPSRRNSLNKDGEKMQRMYFFHGHALLVALLVKHSGQVVNGVPSSLLQDIFDLSVELMSADSSNVPSNSKHIVCSIIRAGALILSSYLTLGYAKCLVNLDKALGVCMRVAAVGGAIQSGLVGNLSSNNLSSKESGQSSPVRADDSVLYEVMTVEAALVAFVALLSNCKDVLTMHEKSLVRIVDTLEICFRNMKNKYQPSFRNHFRFRTFHCILLECFSLLPAGVYPNSSQQIYIEALRVFRDSISLGYECSCGLFNGQSLVSPASALDTLPSLGTGSVPNEKMMIYKLDSHVNVLQKKESEAFLAIFGKDVELLTYFTEDNSLHFLLPTTTQTSGDMTQSSTQKTSSSVMDTRLFDMSIILLALTFAHQSSEYQDKAITLFAQASSQLLNANPGSASGGSAGASGKPPAGKTSSLSLFNSSSVTDEERKKKEKKQYGLHKNIVTVLYAIMQCFPKHSGSYYHEEYAWRQKCIDYLFEVLGQSTSPLVQTRAAQTLSMFATKWTNSQIVASISQKILTVILSTYSHGKKNVVHNAASSDCYIGYIIALGHLYTATNDRTCQSLITTTLIDCIRKMDNYTITFQTAVLASLCVIIQHVIDNISDGALGDSDILPSVVHILQVTLSNVHAHSEVEYGLYLQHSISLASRCIVLSLSYQQQQIQDTTKFGRDGWDLFKHIYTISTLYYGHSDGNGDSNSIPVALIDEICKGMVTIARFDEKHSALTKVTEWFVLLTKQHTSLSLTSVHALTSTLRIYITRFGYGKDNSERDVLTQAMVTTVLDHHVEYILLSLLECTINKSIGSVLGHHTNNIGIEISQDNTHITNTITITTTIIQTIYTALTHLANLDIQIHTHKHAHTPDNLQYNAHTRLVYWLCMCLCMCMELGQKASNSLDAAAVAGSIDGTGGSNVMSPVTDDTIIDREGDGDEGNEGAAGGNEDSANSGDGTIHSTYLALSKRTYQVDSHHHMVILYKDLVTKLTSTTSTTWRVGLKYQMMILVHTLITTHPSCMMSLYTVPSALAPHASPDSVSHAREHVNQYLHQHSNQVTVQMFLSDAPMSPVLVLGELIGLTCNMISYTLHEKYVVSLQDISMATLDKLLEFYKDLHDPDSPEKDTKLLSLFISQIFAAIRTCLSISHHPSITSHTIHTLLTCYMHNISRDYTSLKRIFKPVLTYWQQLSERCGDENASSVCIVNTQSIRCHEDIALQESLVYIHTLAQCYLTIHNHASLFSSPKPDQGLVQVMAQLVGTHTPWGFDVWKRVCEDALRVVCTGRQQEQLVGEGDDISDDALEVDMARGGVFFSPANLSMLSDRDGASKYSVLYMALPAILLALVHYRHEAMLQSVTDVVLYKLTALYGAGAGDGDECKQFLHILEYLSSQPTFNIPYTYWQTIISLHIHNHQTHKLLGVLRSLYANPSYASTIQYVEHVQFLVIVGYGMVYGDCNVTTDAIDGVVHHDLYDVPSVLSSIHKCAYSPHHIHQFIHTLTTVLTKCSTQDIHTHHQLVVTCAYLVYVLSITYIHVSTPDAYTSVYTLMCVGICDSVWKRLGDNSDGSVYSTHAQDIHGYLHYMFALALGRMNGNGSELGGGEAGGIVQLVMLSAAHIIEQESNHGLAETFTKLLSHVLIHALYTTSTHANAIATATLEACIGVVSSLTSQQKSFSLQLFYSSILPVLLTVFLYLQSADSLCVCVKIFLLCYNHIYSTQPDKVHVFLQTFLPILASSVHSHTNTHPAYVAICGQVCMHMYTQSAEIFKGCISNTELLNDDQRFALQMAMKAALAHTHTGHTQAGQKHASGGGVSLNVSKFKK